MKTYMITTITTYVFEAESDEEAINLVENNFSDIEEGIEGEQLETLNVMDESGYFDEVIKDYR